MVWLLASASRANSWSWNPTGSGGSDAVRPVKLMCSWLPVLSALQAPKLEVAACQTPDASRCSDVPTTELFCDAPISTDVSPAAGPEVAANTPSYDRNSTTAPELSMSAMPSGAPFWMPSGG